jgi:hypothetical protein
LKTLSQQHQHTGSQNKTKRNQKSMSTTTKEEEIDLTDITRNNSQPTLISITKARREISRQLQSRVCADPETKDHGQSYYLVWDSSDRLKKRQVTSQIIPPPNPGVYGGTTHNALEVHRTAILAHKRYKAALSKAFLQPHSIASHHKLLTPLHSWQSLSPLHDWVYFYSPSEDRLYQKSNNSWKIYSYHGGRRTRNRQYKYTNHTTPTKPPSATELASVSPRPSPTNNQNLVIVALENHTSWQHEEPEDDLTSYNPTTGPFLCIQDAFDSSIASERILIDEVKLPTDHCQAIATAITNGSANAISDGSYDPITHKGTSSFIIVSGKTDKDPLEGDNWVPGIPKDQSAYRSELAGVGGILASTAIIIQKYNITSGAITIALDEESALDQAESEKPLRISQPDFNLLQDIRARINPSQSQ